MFTGLVTPGEVRRRHLGRGALDLSIAGRGLAGSLRRGDSVAVNGVCLTATAAGRRSFRVQAAPETLARSTLGSLRRGDRVNLELALRLADRLGGHLVQGHVDARGQLWRMVPDGASVRMWFRAPGELRRYIVPKGSIAVDGVSLTVVESYGQSFEVMIVPHTLETTTLGRLRPGGEVNLEVDVMAKYAEGLMAGQAAPRRTQPKD